jgi:hypothetical protein
MAGLLGENEKGNIRRQNTACYGSTGLGQCQISAGFAPGFCRRFGGVGTGRPKISPKHEQKDQKFTDLERMLSHYEDVYIKGNIYIKLSE